MSHRIIQNFTISIIGTEICNTLLKRVKKVIFLSILTDDNLSI